MIYIYGSNRQVGLDDLAVALDAKRLYRFDGESFWDRRRRFRVEVPEGSVIVPWGKHLPEIDGMKILNATEQSRSKAKHLEDLYNAGIPSIRGLESKNKTDYTTLVNSGWMPRKYGTKISLEPDGSADYFTIKHIIIKEYVLHSFQGKSIRFGELVPKNGLTVLDEANFKLHPELFAHPWIRTPEFGWKVDYTVKSTAELRSKAHRAVKFLGLEFAEVSLGLTTTNSIMIVDVNLAPDLSSPTTVKAYVKNIKDYMFKTMTEVEIPQILSDGDPF